MTHCVDPSQASTTTITPQQHQSGIHNNNHSIAASVRHPQQYSLDGPQSGHQTLWGTSAAGLHTQHIVQLAEGPSWRRVLLARTAGSR
eukprot:1158293-Pelagomonas_calceolata.AAC.12